MKFTTSEVFPVSKNRYMEIYLDPLFEQYILEHSNLKKRQILKENRDGDVLKRTVKVCSGVELPAVLKRTVGGQEMCYIEEATIYVAECRTDWLIEPNYLGHKIVASGHTIVHGRGDTQCEREIIGSIEVKIPFIGKVAEKFIIDSIKNTYKDTARLFKEYVRRIDSEN